MKLGPDELQRAIDERSKKLQQYQLQFDRPGLSDEEVKSINENCRYLHHELRKLRYRFEKLRSLLK